LLSGRSFKTVTNNRVGEDVKALLLEKPEIDISEAIRHVHQSYGVMGISVIEDQVQKELYQKYNKVYWQTFRSVLVPKNLLLAIAVLGLIYWGISQIGEYFLIGYAIAYLVATIAYWVGDYIRNRKFKLHKNLGYRISGSYSLGNVVILLQVASRLPKYFTLNTIPALYLNLVLTVLIFFTLITFLASMRTQRSALNLIKGKI
jgi:Mg2+/citrate symporter